MLLNSLSAFTVNVAVLFEKLIDAEAPPLGTWFQFMSSCVVFDVIWFPWVIFGIHVPSSGAGDE